MSRKIEIEVSPVITGPKDQGVEFDAESMTVKRIPAVYSNPSKAGYFRPWRFTQAERSGTSKIFYAKTTRFRVSYTVLIYSIEFEFKFFILDMRKNEQPKV